MHITLSTILLRKPEPFDVDALYRFRNDPEVIASLGGASTGYSRQKMLAWIDEKQNSASDIVWAIADRGTNECLGHAGMYRVDHRAGTCEFGILIGASSRWGRGLGEEITRALVAFAFEELNLRRVELTALATNRRAILLYEKVGFIHEGVKRQAQYRAGEYVDVVMMALLRAEWRR